VFRIFVACFIASGAAAYPLAKDILILHQLV